MSSAVIAPSPSFDKLPDGEDEKMCFGTLDPAEWCPNSQKRCKINKPQNKLFLYIKL